MPLISYSIATELSGQAAETRPKAPALNKAMGCVECVYNYCARLQEPSRNIPNPKLQGTSVFLLTLNSLGTGNKLIWV